jgi:hypothetical protein
MYRVDVVRKGMLRSVLYGSPELMLSKEGEEEVLWADAELDKAMDADPATLFDAASVKFFGDDDDGKFDFVVTSLEDILTTARNGVRKANASAVCISCAIMGEGKPGVGVHVELFHGLIQLTMVLMLDGTKMVLFDHPCSLGRIFDQPIDTNLQSAA